MLCGSFFQTVGPGYAKVRWPVDFVCIDRRDLKQMSVRRGTKLLGRNINLQIISARY